MAAPLRHPPIREAICEVSFDEDEWTSTTVEDLVHAFAADYPVAPSTAPQTVEGPAAPHASRVHAVAGSRLALRNQQGDRVVTFARGVLGVHAVGSYPGWEVFQQRIEHALLDHRRVRHPRKIRQLAVRAVNQIELPDHDADLSRWFRRAPTPVASLGHPVLFSHREVFRCPDGSWLILNLATPDIDGARNRTIALDLNVVAAEDELEWNDIPARLTALHEQASTAFLASITDALKARFDAYP
ncbi:MAG: TIGR04255 family protein [Myxococcales bacterium]|nr:TIGR04255 family protein [Myxococcales bacterium]